MSSIQNVIPNETLDDSEDDKAKVALEEMK